MHVYNCKVRYFDSSSEDRHYKTVRVFIGAENYGEAACQIEEAYGDNLEGFLIFQLQDFCDLKGDKDGVIELPCEMPD